MNKFYLDQNITTLCNHFAERSFKSSLDEYARRKQINEHKIKNDIMLGKLAEFGVYFIYLERGRNNITTPDINVYNHTEKSFSPDLKWGLFNLHVKSQTLESANRYGNSWVFQSKDPVINQSNEYDIFIGTKIEPHKEGYLVHIELEKQIQFLTFGPPKLQKFNANNKTCIYLKDNL